MDDLKKQIEAGNFAVNNGAVIRTVNILNGGWICAAPQPHILTACRIY